MDRDRAFEKLAELISNLHQLEDSLLHEVRPGDLTDLQLQVLTILLFSGPKNLSALSGCLNINLPNCSREVRKLSEKGLVRKEASPEDGRITLVFLSDEGLARVQGFFLQMKRLYFERSGVWSEERSNRLIKAIDVIKSEIDNYEG